VKTTIADIHKRVGSEVELMGWIYNRRSSGSIQFLILRDGSGFIQAVVAKDEVTPEEFDLCSSLTQESSVKLRGRVREDHRAPGGYELTVTGLDVFQVSEEYPITLKEHGIEFLLDNRHLWIRTPAQRAILKIRAEVIRLARGFLDDNGFTLVDTPILTGAACEGTSTLFETDYFGETAYLSQSGQLYSEATIAALGKVYCFGPTFRAEKSKTRRHLIEFWMVEPEMAFFTMEDSNELQERFVSHIVQGILEGCPEHLKELERDTGSLKRVVPPFPRITYDEAIDMLHEKGFDIEWGDDFGSPHETALAESFDRPVFVTHYPTVAKAFYMEPDPDRPEVILGADLLAPEGYGEIIGGSQRIHDPVLLEKRMREHNLPHESYQWYLDLRKYGSVPHSGFGMGIERVVAWICGLNHLREAIPFARLLNRLHP